MECGIIGWNGVKCGSYRCGLSSRTPVVFVPRSPGNFCPVLWGSCETANQSPLLLLLRALPLEVRNIATKTGTEGVVWSQVFSCIILVITFGMNVLVDNFEVNLFL